MVQTEETEKQQKARERREAREAEANTVLGQAAGSSNDGPPSGPNEPDPEEGSSGDTLPEDSIGDTSEDTTSESPIEASEGENEDEVITEGFPPEDTEVIIVPPDFEGAPSTSVTERGKLQVLAGETAVRYRGVIEFNPPRKGMKKNPETGTLEINRIEFFFSDPHVFYWMYNRVAKGMPDTAHPDISRAEAVVLDEGSAVIWRDRNKNERD